MAAEVIVNPRRAPRAAARCRAAVVAPGGAFEAETEDVGSRGCQVIAPRPLRKGDRIQVVVSNDKVPEPLRVAGVVAWASPRAPWRVGIAFDEAAVPQAKGWFDKLLAAHPGLAGLRRVPERIAVDASVYLGPPPRFLRDFTADEAKVLRAIASGVRVDELQLRLRADWPAAQRALFSLLARQAVTLSRGQAVPADAWREVLTEVEASLAVESLGAVPAGLVAPPASRAPVRAPEPPAPRTATPVPIAPPGPPVPAGPAASRWGTPPQDPHPIVELGDDGPAIEIEDPTPAPAAASARPRADFAGAGVGWRARAPRVRTAEAQGIFDRARAEIAAGNVTGAIALLRRALALSPGDPEIADVLGKLAFKDRTPGAE